MNSLPRNARTQPHTHLDVLDHRLDDVADSLPWVQRIAEHLRPAACNAEGEARHGVQTGPSVTNRVRLLDDVVVRLLELSGVEQQRTPDTRLVALRSSTKRQAVSGQEITV